MTAKRTNRLALGVVVILAVVAGSAASFASPNYWGQIDQPLSWFIFLLELTVGSTILWNLAGSTDRRARTPGIALATALLGATLLDTPLSGAEAGVLAAPLMLCFALGLAVVFAATRRWNLFWLAMAALWGGVMLVVSLVGLAVSFMS